MASYTGNDVTKMRKHSAHGALDPYEVRSPYVFMLTLFLKDLRLLSVNSSAFSLQMSSESQESLEKQILWNQNV